jgi:hypothetical protein
VRYVTVTTHWAARSLTSDAKHGFLEHEASAKTDEAWSFLHGPTAQRNATGTSVLYASLPSRVSPRKNVSSVYISGVGHTASRQDHTCRGVPEILIEPEMSGRCHRLHDASQQDWHKARCTWRTVVVVVVGPLDRNDVVATILRNVRTYSPNSTASHATDMSHQVQNGVPRRATLCHIQPLQSPGCSSFSTAIAVSCRCLTVDEH